MFCPCTFFIFTGTQAVNFCPSTDRHKIFTQNFRGGWAYDIHFEILIFDPKKFGWGKPPKFQQILPNGRQSEIHNFEMARDIE